MKKRMLSLLLAITLLIPCLPAQRIQAAVGAQNLESQIAAQYDTFVKSLKAEGASEGAAQLVKHSIKGGGTLNMGVNDKFAKALLSSQMYRANFIHAASVAVRHMQSTGDAKLFMRGTYGWYENKMYYGNSAWQDNENGNDEDDIHLSSVRASQNPYTGAVNTYDEGMFLVVGTASGRMTFQETAIDRDTVTYKVSIQLYDSFDFNGGDYQGNDSGLAETLTWLGRLLSLGLLTTFDWSVSGELEITVPNTCTHESADYRWEFDGVDSLVDTNGNDANPLHKTETIGEDGTVVNTTYKMEKAIRLEHDRPWSLEIKCSGDEELSLREHLSLQSGGKYFRKAKHTAFFGEYAFANETDEKKTLAHYGVWFVGKGPVNISSADTHTYRLTNKVSDDGSNMVYLYIDDIDFGPMNQYYHSGTSQNSTSDWANGKNFNFASVSIRNGVYRDSDTFIDYIQVWENGKDNAPYDYCITKELESTCTEDGGNAQVCRLCGAVVSMTDVKSAFGHSFGPWELVREAACDREGQEKRVCSTCGEAETRQLPKPDHVFPEEWTVSQEATCKAEGEERKACQNCGEEQIRKLPKADHNYIPEVVAPTCYSQGYTLHTCKWCGSSYKDTLVNALGHKPGTFVSDGNVTCTKDGTMSAECTRCDMRLTITEEATGHKYENGICTVCGEKDENYTEKFSLYGSSMTLGNALDMNFFVYQSDIEGTGNYAVITKHYADGREDAVVKVEQGDWNTLGSAYYYFTFSGVRAKEMADKVEVVIYNADGKAISEVFTDSVQNYARRMLDNPETIAAHRTLYIEMLNYGAAAQVEFKYDVDNLANSVITEEEQNAYGMSDRTYENQRQNDDAYYGTTLTLENQIVFNIFYNGNYIPEGAYAVATFTNHKGEQMEEKVTSFATVAGYKYASFKSLVVADCSELITVTLYDADGNVISTVTDSIEGYAARMTEVGPLYDAIMKFADAAYQYFHS